LSFLEISGIGVFSVPMIKAPVGFELEKSSSMRKGMEVSGSCSVPCQVAVEGNGPGRQLARRITAIRLRALSMTHSTVSLREKVARQPTGWRAG
jgi:hypothetical protein